MIAHTLVLTDHRGFLLSNFFPHAPGNRVSIYQAITPQMNCKCLSIHKNMPYERSSIYKLALWVIIYFPMSNQMFINQLCERSYISNERSNGYKSALWAIIYFPMSDQTFINQLCERSYIFQWAIKSILMIAHTLLLTAHWGFFGPISFIMPWKSIFPISSDYTTKEL